jgi:hypothetical protein
MEQCFLSLGCWAEVTSLERSSWGSQSLLPGVMASQQQLLWHLKEVCCMTVLAHSSVWWIPASGSIITQIGAIFSGLPLFVVMLWLSAKPLLN